MNHHRKLQFGPCYHTVDSLINRSCLLFVYQHRVIYNKTGLLLQSNYLQAVSNRNNDHFQRVYKQNLWFENEQKKMNFVTHKSMDSTNPFYLI